MGYLALFLLEIFIAVMPNELFSLLFLVQVIFTTVFTVNFWLNSILAE